MGNLRRLFRINLIALMLPAVAATSPTNAADPPAKAVKPKPGQLRLPSGEILEPLVPRKANSKAQQAHQKALVHFMAGKLRESRRDFRGAYAEYQKAIAVEPKAVEVYRALVPLAFGLGKQSDAIKYAYKAIELDPDDYSLLRQLGVSWRHRIRSLKR